MPKNGIAIFSQAFRKIWIKGIKKAQARGVSMVNSEIIRGDPVFYPNPAFRSVDVILL